MDARFFYKELICFIRWSLLLNIFLDGAEISQILNLECLDVSRLTKYILFGHANINVSTLGVLIIPCSLIYLRRCR